MKYFCCESERRGTCYHEFQKGKWDDKTFWKNDSLLLHDDILRKHKLYEIFLKVDSNYNDYGETEIDSEKWKEIRSLSNVIGGEVKDIIDEANAWVDETLKAEGVFTILGI